MKNVLFSGHASLFPAEHGGAKNVRHTAEGLAAAGLAVRVLVKMHPPVPGRIRFAGQHPDGLRASRHEFDKGLLEEERGVFSWSCRGVTYKAVPGESRDLAAATRREIELQRPHAVVLCDDSLDEGLELYEAGADSGRLVFLAQTIHSLPFGPYAMKPSAPVSAALQRAKKVVAPSRFVADYIAVHLGKEAEVHYPDVFGKGPFPDLGGYDNPYITMINPCPWKGSSILIKLARRRPDLAFAAVPTWGATPPLVAELKAAPNITVLEETPRIDEIYAKTKVLLAPSMCQEAFGLVSPEALLRGIPVVASDIAGLRESTLGAAALVPVTPLPFDGPREGTDHTKFVWTEPDNPVEPWSAALDAILESEASYRRCSLQGREAAGRFVKGLAGRPLLV